MTKLSAAPPREKSVNTNNYDFPALSSLFFGQEQWWVGCPRRAAADCTLTYDDDDDDDDGDDDDHEDDHDIEEMMMRILSMMTRRKLSPSGSAPPHTS